MSKKQAIAFRKFVNENESVQEQIRKGAADGSFSQVEMAAKHGFAFTAEEAESVWTEVQGGELSDFELEVCAGGRLADTTRNGTGMCW